MSATIKLQHLCVTCIFLHIFSFVCALLSLLFSAPLSLPAKALFLFSPAKYTFRSFLFLLFPKREKKRLGGSTTAEAGEEGGLFCLSLTFSSSSSAFVFFYEKKKLLRLNLRISVRSFVQGNLQKLDKLFSLSLSFLCSKHSYCFLRSK